MTFSKALEILKQGTAITRQGWHKSGMWLQIQRPDVHSKMTLPYIYMAIPKNNSEKYDLVPWLASQTDILAEDWIKA